MPISDGHHTYQCRTAFWEKNKETDGREYIHRSEFEQNFLDLHNELAAMKHQKEEYQSKFYRSLQKLTKYKKDISQNKRLSKTNTELSWALERIQEEARHSQVQNQAILEKTKQHSWYTVKKMKKENQDLAQQNESLQIHIEKIEEKCKESKSENKALRSQIRELRKHDNQKKIWSDNLMSFHTKKLEKKVKEQLIENRRLKRLLKVKERKRTQMFDGMTNTRALSKSMETEVSELRAQNEELKEEITVLQSLKGESEKFINRNSLYPLFIHLSQIVAKVRARHHAYRGQTDVILSDIRSYIDAAIKESWSKQITLQNILKCGSPIKGGKKGKMVAENKAHTEYLRDMMQVLHKKIHQLWRINREDERCDAWKRVKVKLKADSTMTNTKDLPNVVVGDDDDEEKAVVLDKSRLTEEDIHLMQKMHVFFDCADGDKIDELQQFIDEHRRDSLVIHI